MNDLSQQSVANDLRPVQKWHWWRILIPAIITQITVVLIMIAIFLLTGGLLARSSMCAEMALLVCGALLSVGTLLIGIAAYFAIGIPVFYKWRIGNFGGVVTLGFVSTILIVWIVSVRSSLLPVVALPLIAVIELGAFVFWDWLLNAVKARRVVKAVWIAIVVGLLLFGALFNNGAVGIYTAAQSNDLKNALQKAPMTIYAPAAGSKWHVTNVYSLDSSTDTFSKGVQLTLSNDVNLSESATNSTDDPLVNCAAYIDGATGCQVATTTPSGIKVYVTSDQEYFAVLGHTLITTGSTLPYSESTQDLYDLFNALSPTSADTLVKSLPTN